MELTTENVMRLADAIPNGAYVDGRRFRVGNYLLFIAPASKTKHVIYLLGSWHESQRDGYDYIGIDRVKGMRKDQKWHEGTNAVKVGVNDSPWKISNVVQQTLMPMLEKRFSGPVAANVRFADAKARRRAQFAEACMPFSLPLKDGSLSTEADVGKLHISVSSAASDYEPTAPESADVHPCNVRISGLTLTQLANVLHAVAHLDDDLAGEQHEER